MIFAHQFSMRSLVLPLILIAMLALAGCGSSAAEAATVSESAPAVQATQQPQAMPTTAEAAPAPVAAQPVDAPNVQKVAAVAAGAASAVETGIPTRLVLPSIKLDTGVTELGWSTAKNKEGQVFSEWDVAEYAAGWHKNSAEPGLGENVVLSGHNNILGAVFRELDQLKRGDKAVLYVGDKPFEYVIDKVMIVPERTATAEQRLENGAWIQPTGEERLTLVSCWPRDDNSHRIIVIAHPATTN